MAMIAAMKNVLSPNSLTMIMLIEARKADANFRWYTTGSTTITFLESASR
mgnify:CR=1 FL=1